LATTSATGTSTTRRAAQGAREERADACLRVMARHGTAGRGELGERAVAGGAVDLAQEQGAVEPGHDRRMREQGLDRGPQLAQLAPRSGHELEEPVGPRPVEVAGANALLRELQRPHARQLEPAGALELGELLGPEPRLVLRGPRRMAPLLAQGPAHGLGEPERPRHAAARPDRARAAIVVVRDELGAEVAIERAQEQRRVDDRGRIAGAHEARELGLRTRRRPWARDRSSSPPRRGRRRARAPAPRSCVHDSPCGCDIVVHPRLEPGTRAGEHGSEVNAGGDDHGRTRVTAKDIDVPATKKPAPVRKGPVKKGPAKKGR
jgi:hypothetical protein